MCEIRLAQSKRSTPLFDPRMSPKVVTSQKKKRAKGSLLPSNKTTQVGASASPLREDGSPLRAKVSELRGRRLGCWCLPEPCHAQILAELAEAKRLAAGLPRVVRAGCWSKFKQRDPGGGGFGDSGIWGVGRNSAKGLSRLKFLIDRGSSGACFHVPGQPVVGNYVFLTSRCSQICATTMEIRWCVCVCVAVWGCRSREAKGNHWVWGGRPALLRCTHIAIVYLRGLQWVNLPFGG